MYIKYGDVAVEVVPQQTACCYSFLWAKGLNANEIHIEMHPVVYAKLHNICDIIRKRQNTP